MKRSRCVTFDSTLVDNRRNLDDAQLDALKASGAVIAINAFSAYLRPRSAETLSEVTALKRDFGLRPGGPALSAARQADYDRRYHDVVGREPRASVSELIDAVDQAVKRIGIDHVALSSDFNQGGGTTGLNQLGETGNVTAELKRRGYSATAIDKLWGGNVLRVWQAAIDARRAVSR